MAMSRRKRANVIRYTQYVILILIVAAIAVFADWPTIKDAFFDPEAAANQFPRIIQVALVNTIIYTVLGFALGLVLGLLFAMMKLSKVAPYRWIATVYIEFFRGIPALLVFLALGYGVPLAFGIRFDIYSTVMIALGLVGSAYMAETIRAGIQAVPKGQVEAARSLGMNPTRAMITIVLPQAFRIILPPLTNELILLTKDSSLVFLLGVVDSEWELTKLGREGLNASGSLTPILLVGVAYLIITLPLGYLSRSLERRTGRQKDRGLKVEA